ncbi:hypothetical protein LJC23_04725 [Desulfovibrio sp. OttesenSCG-928-I05]|nr:hypothetical protein [Desulfovibrio sp. OttesenSCG-928-I05]
MDDKQQNSSEGTAATEKPVESLSEKTRGFYGLLLVFSLKFFPSLAFVVLAFSEKRPLSLVEFKAAYRTVINQLFLFCFVIYVLFFSLSYYIDLYVEDFNGFLYIIIDNTYTVFAQIPSFTLLFTFVAGRRSGVRPSRLEGLVELSPLILSALLASPAFYFLPRLYPSALLMIGGAWAGIWISCAASGQLMQVFLRKYSVSNG